MTTVVATQDTMVSDSKATGDMITSVAKIWRIRDGLLGCAGEVAIIQQFVAWFRGGCKGAPPDMSDSEALYLTPTKLVCFDLSHYGYEIKDHFAAIGSGAPAALGALWAGADPAHAVRCASKVDPYTGGRVVIKRL